MLNQKGKKALAEEDDLFMGKALHLARRAFDEEEVPVGAIVVFDGKIVGRAYNKRESMQSPTAHAELLAIEKAAKKLWRWRLFGCTMFVTLEPCAMCAGALVNARLERLVFGALDPKAGAVLSLMNICSDKRLNHRLKIRPNVRATESSKLLKDFFRKRR